MHGFPVLMALFCVANICTSTDMKCISGNTTLRRCYEMDMFVNISSPPNPMIMLRWLNRNYIMDFKTNGAEALTSPMTPVIETARELKIWVGVLFAIIPLLILLFLCLLWCYYYWRN